jgi:hypothetical protein
MANTISDLIPEINQIQDDTLRGKVTAVWEDALNQGGWKLADLETMPYTLLVDDVDITFPEHVSVVCRLCIAMEGVLVDAYGDRYALDRDILIAGALLADVGKLLEFSLEEGEYVWASTYQYLRHPFTGVALCYKHQLPESVMHMVATHSWEGEKFTRRPESIIFHHADFTDFDLTKFASKHS